MPIKGGQWDLVAVSSRGDFAVTDVALYDVRVDVPDGWELATTGARVASDQLGDGGRRERFVSHGGRPLRHLGREPFPLWI